MLTAEDNLNESDEVLLCSPIDGIAYQLAAALARLGRKTTGLFASKADMEAMSPLQLSEVEYSFAKPIAFSENPLSGDLHPLNSFVLSFNSELSRNEVPAPGILAAALELGQSLLAKYPNLHFIGLFPSRVPENIVSEFFALAPARSTFFRVPALFGMRDRFIFDHLMALEASQISHLKKDFTESYQTPLTFVADLVGFLVSTIGKPQYKNKIINVPANFSNPADLALHFEEHHAYQGSAFQRIKALSAILNKNPLESFLLQQNYQRNLEEPLFTMPIVDALEIFPTALTTPQRMIKHSFYLKNQFPELYSHFPPSRAL